MNNKCRQGGPPTSDLRKGGGPLEEGGAHPGGGGGTDRVSDRNMVERQADIGRRSEMASD